MRLAAAACRPRPTAIQWCASGQHLSGAGRLPEMLRSLPSSALASSTRAPSLVRSSALAAALRVCGGNAKGLCDSLCISRLTMRAPVSGSFGSWQQPAVLHDSRRDRKLGLLAIGTMLHVLNSVYSPLGAMSMRSVVFPEPCRPVQVHRPLTLPVGQSMPPYARRVPLYTRRERV